MNKKAYISETIIAYYLVNNKVIEEIVSFEEIENSNNLNELKKSFNTLSPAVCKFNEKEENELGIAVCFNELYNEENEIEMANLSFIDLENIKYIVKKMNSDSKIYEYIICEK